MNVYYDLHIHTCLSPCGDMDMTPNNIINMAKLLNLQIIAITDHNTSKNCEPIMKLGEENGICVIPGMELTTSEDIHVVCLFPTLDDAMSFNSYVEEHQMKLKNKEKIYGRQVMMNDKDEEIGSIDHLLILATDISISKVKKLVEKYNGIAYPAHIDRDSLSILSVLGDIPKEFHFTTCGFSFDGNKEEIIKRFPILKTMHLVTSSDAHYLENLREASQTINVNSIDRKSIIEYFK